MLKMFAFALALATTAPQPKSASIVDTDESFDNLPIGNVRVTFTDGHTEKWTRLGKYENPRVSASGLVAWECEEGRARWNYPVFYAVRVCWPDGHHRDFHTDECPFVEEWNFTDNDTALIIKSRGPHGNADYLKYNISTGEVLDHAHAQVGQPLPLWAQPYSD